jgi:hypothetical protein
MTSNITIDTYIDETCSIIDKFIQQFTKNNKLSKPLEYINFIDTNYPFIQVIRHYNMTSSYNIKYIAFTNEDICKKASTLLKDVEMEFPVLYINELYYGMLKSNVYILDLMYDLMYRSYDFFDEESPKILIRLLNLEAMHKCFNSIMMNITNTRKVKTTIRNINKSMRKFLETDYGSDGEGYSTITRMAILIYGRKVMHYDIFRSWWLNNKKIISTSQTLSSTNTPEGASILHWCMTFYVMEHNYNTILNVKYYDENIWNNYL